MLLGDGVISVRYEWIIKNMCLTVKQLPEHITRPTFGRPSSAQFGCDVSRSSLSYLHL